MIWRLLRRGAKTVEELAQSLEITDNADERLIEMKRKMGLLPPAAPPAQNTISSGQPQTQQKQIGATSSSPIRDAELIEEFEELERGSEN